MQDPGSVRVNQDHGSLASRVRSRVTSLSGQVGSRVSVADPVPSLALTPPSTDNWNDLKPVAYNAAVKVIGFRNRCHKDWFDDYHDAMKLLEDIHVKHLSWMTKMTKL